MRAPASIFALLAIACGPTANLDLTLERSELIPTVYTATLAGQASGLDEAWIEYGIDDAFDLVAPLDMDAQLPWEVTLLGMKAGSDYQVRTAVAVGDQVYTGRAHSVSTGLVPADFPNMWLEAVEEASFEGYLVSSAVITPSSIVLDRDGDYVWWYQPEGFSTQGRTVMSRSGDAMLTLDLNAVASEDNSLVRISLDGSSVESSSIPRAHHDLYEHEDGTIAYLARDPLEVKGREITGDSIVELEPDGSTRMIWSAWDSEEALPFDIHEIGPGGEWPHANALDYLPDLDAYLVSFLYLDAIARIDRKTGTIDWVMGGDHSDFELVGGGTDIFERSHQMHWLDGSLLVFVNGHQQGGVSRAVEYAVDEQAMQVESVWEYWSEPDLNCITLGDVHRFDDGDTLVTYSYSGQIQQVTPEGEPVWVLSAGVGGIFGYTTPVESLYVE